ncbi:hypothetical protein [Campylobacter sp.]|nr:hypothetical protein [Campylobacter sp.]MDY3245463.1 hypothetical protein [Campylobacter sp.]
MKIRTTRPLRANLGVMNPNLGVINPKVIKNKSRLKAYKKKEKNNGFSY